MAVKKHDEKAGQLPESFRKLMERKEPYTAQEIEAVEEKIYIARSNFLMRQPFFGLMAMHLKLVNSSNWLMTAATDGKHFYYNVGFFLLLTPAEIQFVYGHEILHVAYDHFGRSISTNQDFHKYIDNNMTFDEKAKLNAQLVNIAADYCVNRDLIKYNVGSLLREEVIKLYYDKKYDEKIMEEIYMELLQDPSMTQKGSMLDDHGVGNCGAGESHRKANPDGEEGMGDKQGGSPVGMTDEEREEAMKNFREKMINAYDQQKDHERVKREEGQDAGSLPADLERLIQRMRKPEINWRNYIRQRITTLFRDTDDWSRPNRRSFDGAFITPGQKNSEKVDIHIAIDTSGSIGQQEMADFLSEISGISQQFKDYKIRVWTFDARVYKEGMKEFTPGNIRDLPKYKFLGGGGTSFLANWVFMQEMRIKPKLFIMFTDGYTGDDFGVPKYCPTIYVVNTDVEVPEKYGKTIRYKPRRK